MTDPKIANSMVHAGLLASRHIIHLRNSNTIQVEWKPDYTPVTNADLEANEIICKALRVEYPELAIISEELDNSNTPRDMPYFLIDPIDGTHGFTRGNTQFTVNLAFVKNGMPIAGVIMAPALDEIYFNNFDNQVFFGTGITSEVSLKSIKPPPISRSEPLIALLSCSKKHRDEESSFLSNYGSIEIQKINSSIKLAYLAIGRGHIYPRFGTLNEWDIAAGRSLIHASGGRVVNFENGNLSFTRPDFQIGPFVALAKGVGFKGDPAK